MCRRRLKKEEPPRRTMQTLIAETKTIYCFIFIYLTQKGNGLAITLNKAKRSKRTVLNIRIGSLLRMESYLAGSGLTHSLDDSLHESTRIIIEQHFFLSSLRASRVMASFACCAFLSCPRDCSIGGANRWRVDGIVNPADNKTFMISVFSSKLLNEFLITKTKTLSEKVKLDLTVFLSFEKV